MPNEVNDGGNVPLDNTPLEYSLLVVGERAGGRSKCRGCKRYINIKGELYFQVFKPSSLHGSSYRKYFHPECLEYPDAPDANAFVDTLVIDGSKNKILNNAEGKNKLVQDMNKDARTKSTEPASGTAPARVRIGKKIDTLPNLETALPWDPSYWKPEWAGVLFQNAGIRDMLIDVIKYYGERAGERAEKGDDLAKVVAGVWIRYYIKVIDYVVGLKEEITVQSAKALPHTSNGVVSEEVAKCISMYAGSSSLNTIIENVKAGDRDADEWEEKEAAAKEAAATAKGDNKEGMESVRSDAEEEQQLKDAIELSLVDAQEGDDNKDAGADEDMEEVEVAEEAAEEMMMDEPKGNEEEV